MLPPPPQCWQDGSALGGVFEMYSSAVAWAASSRESAASTAASPDASFDAWLDEAETCHDGLPTDVSDLLRLASLDDMPTLPIPAGV